MANNSFVLLSRSILDSQVFANEKMLKIWIWCLCKANHKKAYVPLRVGKGVTTVEVKRGQFIFGRSKAEEELYYDGSTIYKIMQKFQAMEMIEIESNNQYSIITVCNYDDYQDAGNYEVATKEQPMPNQRTAEEQHGSSTVAAEEQHGNTNKNVNNDKNDKNVKKSSSPGAEPTGSEGEEEVKLAGKYQRFLDFFNTTCKRSGNSLFRTMPDKAQRQLDKLIKKGFTKEDYERAISNGYKDSLRWTNPGQFTPEYITREVEFNKYLVMQFDAPAGTAQSRGNFNLQKIAEEQRNKVYK